MCEVSSSNTNAITGAGTVNFSNVTFVSTSSVVNTTTQASTYTNIGKFKATQQPCFSAHNSGTISNVTGDGTTYTVILDTKDFDQGTNYSTSTGLFTAPVAGTYMFNFNLAVTGLGAGHTSMIIQTTGTSEMLRVNPIAEAVSGNVTYSGAILLSLGASATMGLTLTISGSTKTVSITNVPTSRFQGFPQNESLIRSRILRVLSLPTLPSGRSGGNETAIAFSRIPF
jgi:hypothetical protein